MTEKRTFCRSKRGHWLFPMLGEPRFICNACGQVIPEHTDGDPVPVHEQGRRYVG